MYKLMMYAKADFYSVKFALEQLLKRDLPNWVVLIYYVILVPIGIVGLPFVLAWKKYRIYKIEKEWDEEFGDK